MYYLQIGIQGIWFSKIFQNQLFSNNKCGLYVGLETGFNEPKSFNSSFGLIYTKWAYVCGYFLFEHKVDKNRKM